MFAAEQRAFIIDIKEIAKLKSIGKNSINIKTIDKWGIIYTKIQTVPSKKALLAFCCDIESLRIVIIHIQN